MARPKYDDTLLIRLPSELKAQLEEVAQRGEHTSSSLVRLLIRQAVEKSE